ncbi:flagellin [Georgenia thermotolerans]|uniref:Flagellin n=1 Tax=Georgenia thermotolerans TaxID=527326 RepID=A0A7J5UPA8_9MICO|nr:flagellin [Georgenia thermotolerans]KAE8764071.1 flagellin [Georgenia thermotolerans]
MALTINNNIAAVNAYRNLSNTQNDLSKSLEKLSSGFRINRAADDAAGLAISEGLRSQVGGLKVAARNAQDGISVVQTAEGALTEVHSILQRMRDLAVQAANDSNNGEARANIATEVTSLQSELTRIAESTNFNGTKLLNGDVTELKFQVGADGDGHSQITVNLANVNVKAMAANLGNSGAKFDVLTPTDVTGAMAFTNGTTDVSVTLGAAGTYKTVQDVADALNSDADFANTFAASVNKDNQLVVTSKTGGTVTGGTAASAAAAGTGVGTATAIAGGLSFADADGAQAAINLIDTQIGTISTARAELGAYQNRLEHTIKNINVSIENLSASESRIRDTDMASEMVNFTRSQILSQAGTAMLAQANQIPQGVLQLLR